MGIMQTKVALRVEGSDVIFGELTRLAHDPDLIHVQSEPVPVWVFETSGVYVLPSVERQMQLGGYYPELEDVLKVMLFYLERTSEEFGECCRKHDAKVSLLITLSGSSEDLPEPRISNKFLQFAARIGARIDWDIRGNLGAEALIPDLMRYIAEEE